jgi:hypothetical protein
MGKCPQCNEVFDLDDHATGKKKPCARCPRCNRAYNYESGERIPVQAWIDPTSGLFLKIDIQVMPDVQRSLPLDQPASRDTQQRTSAG